MMMKFLKNTAINIVLSWFGCIVVAAAYYSGDNDRLVQNISLQFLISVLVLTIKDVARFKTDQ